MSPRIGGDSKLAAEIGYIRAVRDGRFVFVAGTTGLDHRTLTINPDPAAQAEAALRTIAAALEAAGARIDDVVRVRYIAASAEDFRACWPVLRQWFDIARPAATMIVAGLLDARMKIEIEVTALLPED
ncbi:Rid family hydrolase [Roseitranquillus sediminis]|uniref:Rid family hydrolase n=1 Tax=Roseitranquillus sediminis TaxID=2809051 RepID=UPI001D0CC307|nr:Rid family hydrolase [Roseitranquillus sediminis]MBM9595359.1 RidA family protein [Roseitranquillus sediminis]